MGGNGGSPLEIAHPRAGLVDRGQMETRSKEGPNEGLCTCKYILFYSLGEREACGITLYVLNLCYNKCHSA